MGKKMSQEMSLGIQYALIGRTIKNTASKVSHRKVKNHKISVKNEWKGWLNSTKNEQAMTIIGDFDKGCKNG